MRIFLLLTLMTLSQAGHSAPAKKAVLSASPAPVFYLNTKETRPGDSRPVHVLLQTHFSRCSVSLHPGFDLDRVPVFNVPELSFITEPSPARGRKKVTGYLLHLFPSHYFW